jgi:hypothetical protein
LGQKSLAVKSAHHLIGDNRAKKDVESIFGLASWTWHSEAANQYNYLKHGGAFHGRMDFELD